MSVRDPRSADWHAGPSNCMACVAAAERARSSACVAMSDARESHEINHSVLQSSYSTLTQLDVGEPTQPTPTTKRRANRQSSSHSSRGTSNRLARSQRCSPRRLASE